jgi:formate hydrogenlyase subunit 3/multisubunit Na+/H+ antiporter MnhD subunit
MGISYLVLAHGIGLVGILALCSWIEGEDEPHLGDKLGLSPSWKHLGIHHPFLAVAVCILAANLLGFPLTMGFWSRVALLESILSTEMSLSLVMIAVAGWAVSSLVLIRLIKAMWFPRRRDGISLLTPDKPPMDRIWDGLEEDDSSSFAGLASGDNDSDKVDTSSLGARLLRIVVFATVGLVVIGGLWPEPFLRFFSGNP